MILNKRQWSDDTSALRINLFFAKNKPFRAFYEHAPSKTFLTLQAWERPTLHSMQITNYIIGANSPKAPTLMKNASPLKCHIMLRSRPGSQYLHMLDDQWVNMVPVPGVIQTYWMLPRLAIDWPPGYQRPWNVCSIICLWRSDCSAPPCVHIY